MRYVFENVGCYVTVVPTYVWEGLWLLLVWSSKKACLGQIALSDLQARFYISAPCNRLLQSISSFGILCFARMDIPIDRGFSEKR